MSIPLSYSLQLTLNPVRCLLKHLFRKCVDALKCQHCQQDIFHVGMVGLRRCDHTEPLLGDTFFWELYGVRKILANYRGMKKTVVMHLNITETKKKALGRCMFWARRLETTVIFFSKFKFHPTQLQETSGQK